MTVIELIRLLEEENEDSEVSIVSCIPHMYLGERIETVEANVEGSIVSLKGVDSA